MENKVELIRKIDSRHRISIPTMIMKELRLEDGESVKITYDMNGIHISKTHDQCLVCSGKSDYNIMGVKLCYSCLSELILHSPKITIDIPSSITADKITTGVIRGTRRHTSAMDECSASGCASYDKIRKQKRR